MDRHHKYQTRLSRPLTTEDALAIAREALRKAITEADNITDTNVGEEAFQIPTIAFDALAMP